MDLGFTKGFFFADWKNGGDSVFDLFSLRHQRIKESLGQLWTKFDFMTKRYELHWTSGRCDGGDELKGLGVMGVVRLG